MRMLLLLSHNLTQEQETDSRVTLGVNEFIHLPDELKQLWSNIPADKETVRDTLEPIGEFMQNNLEEGDYVLIHGDFGAVYLMVQFSFILGLIPVYSTTERLIREKRISSNEIKVERVFKHVLFRKYERKCFN